MDVSSTGTGTCWPLMSTVPCVVPKEMVEIGYALLLGLGGGGERPAGVVGRRGHRLLAVREQHDAGRWRALAAGHERSQGVDGLQGREDGLAGGRALPELEVVDGGADRRTVRGRRHEDDGAAGERDEAQVDPRGEPVGEGLRGLLGGLQPGRGDVGGLHGQRHVDGEDDRGPVAGDLHIAGRPGQRDGQTDQPHEQQRGRDVARPARALGCHPLEQREVGEAHRVAVAPSLHQHVPGQQEHHREQQQEPQRGRELRQAHRRATEVARP